MDPESASNHLSCARADVALREHRLLNHHRAPTGTRGRLAPILKKKERAPQGALRYRCGGRKSVGAVQRTGKPPMLFEQEVRHRRSQLVEKLACRGDF